MPKKVAKEAVCEHRVCQLDPSRYAEDVYGYTQPSDEARVAASLPSGRASPGSRLVTTLNTTFPGALVLPEDELAWEPQYEPQSLKTWMDGDWRNAVTEKRRTLYVVPPPAADDETQYIIESLRPKLGAEASMEEFAIDPPAVDDVTDYLSAFYHGLPVQQSQSPNVRFVQWDQPKSQRQSSRVGLRIGNEIIGIRVRPSKDGVFDHQLNLQDLLDAAMRILPRDAYALIMLVHHDLYEDDDDDFCCGRAYGGSRVAVISTARYNPAFDEKLEVERVHAWPASHCAQYIEKCCLEADVAAGVKPPRKRTKLTPYKQRQPIEEALRMAVPACRELPSPSTPERLAALWLGRACKTASHELGHCFGMDHCVYYACVMQGTTGLSEDARQPPYLCPVDLAKVLFATGSQEADRYKALLKFCERWKDDCLFSAFSAWLRVRIEQIEPTSVPTAHRQRPDVKYFLGET